MKNHFGKIQYKIPKTILLILLLIIVLSGFAIGVLMVELVDTHLMYNSQKIDSLTKEISILLEENRQLANKIYNDPDILEKQFLPENQEKLAERMNFYKSSNVYIESVYLYTDLNQKLHINGRIKAEDVHSYQKDPELVNYLQPESSATRKRISFVSRKKNGHNLYTFFVYPHNNSNDAVIINYYNKYIDIEPWEKEEGFFIFDSQGKILVGPLELIDQNISESSLPENFIEEYASYTGRNIIRSKGKLYVYDQKNDLNYVCILNVYKILGQNTMIFVFVFLLIAVIVLLSAYIVFKSKQWWRLFVTGVIEKFDDLMADSLQNKRSGVLQALMNRSKYYTNTELESMELYSDRQYFAVLCKLNYPVGLGLHEQNALRYAVKNILVDILNGISYDAVDCEEKHLLFLMGESSRNSEELVERIRVAQMLTEENIECSFSVFVAEDFSGIKNISAAFESLKQCAEYEYYYGSGCFLKNSDLLKNTDFKEPDVEQLFSDLMECLTKDGINGGISLLTDRKEELLRLNPTEGRNILVKLSELATARLGMPETEQNSLANLLKNAPFYQEAVTLLVNHLQEISAKLESKSWMMSARITDDAIEMIRNHYSDSNFNRSDIAEALNISINHLDRLFKANTGQTTANYIFYYRLKIAEQLLLETQDSVGTIAERVGYLSTSYFIQNFKKVYGKTPDKYRLQQ